MNLSFLNKIFPAPKYLEISTVGIDISDESIKFAELSRSFGRYRLRRSGEIGLPVGTIVAGKIAKEAPLLEALKTIRAKTGYRFVHASLPEEETFVVRMKVPWVEPEGLRDSIELQLEEYIPLSADQVIFDYEIYEQPTGEDGNYLVGVYVSPRKLVESYSEILKGAGLFPASLEIEVQSAARALLPPGDKGTYLIADLGKTRTGFSIVSRGKVMFTSTIKSVGGANLTKAVEHALGVTYAEAETIKIKNGLSNSDSNRAAFEAMIPVSSIFKDEIGRHYNFWEGLRQSGEVREPITKLIFCGGQSTLPGLVEYISGGLPVSIELGNPWRSLVDRESKIPPLPLNESVRYVAALGLALRGAINQEP